MALKDRFKDLATPTSAALRKASENGGERPPERVMRIPVDWIDTDPGQPRKAFDEQKMEELVGSLREHGQLQAGLVEEKPDGRFRLISGERRLRAIREAGIKVFLATVRTPNDEGRRLVWQLVENLQRADLAPVEEAAALKKLNTEFGMTHAQISRWLGRSEARVGEIIRLMDLSEAQLQSIGSAPRRISTSQLLEVVKAPEAKKDLLLESLLKEGASVKALRKARKKRGKLKAQVQYPAQTFETSAGIRVVVSSSSPRQRSISRGVVLRALEEATELCRQQLASA